MATVLKNAQNTAPISSNGAQSASSGREGHSMRASRRVSSRLPSPNSGATSRGDHSFTPNSHQPR